MNQRDVVKHVRGLGDHEDTVHYHLERAMRIAEESGAPLDFIARCQELIDNIGEYMQAGE